MNTITMYRFALTGDFGYAAFREAKEIIRVSGWAGGPVKISVGEHCFNSIYEAYDQPRGVFDSASQEPAKDPTIRVITDKAGELVARLYWKSTYYIMTVCGMEIEIRNNDRSYQFLVDGSPIAVIRQSASDKRDILDWMKADCCYHWENMLELSCEADLPEILVGLIFAFPMLRFDYYFRGKPAGQT